MTVKFIIGTLPGQNEPNVSYIQDSRLEDYDMVYWVINEQPSNVFTQDKATRRVTASQTFNANDVIVCHLK